MIGGILGGLGSLFKIGLGATQLARARRMNATRPTYQIPEEVRRNQALAQTTLTGRTPYAAQQERNIYQSASTGLYNARQAATNSAALLSAGAATQGMTNRAMSGLAARESADYYNRLGNLQRQNQMMAGYRDKQFDINEMQPYYETMAARSALMEGGLQNLYGGITGAGRVAGQGYMLNQMNPSLFGNGIAAGYMNDLRNRYGAANMTQGVMNTAGGYNALGNAVMGGGSMMGGLMGGLPSGLF
jgi:hypothetical protein